MVNVLQTVIITTSIFKREFGGTGAALSDWLRLFFYAMFGGHCWFFLPLLYNATKCQKR